MSSALWLWLLSSIAVVQAAAPRPDQVVFREIYRELVETDTSHSSGDCTLAATRMLRHLREAGYGREEAEVFVPEGHPREGGLVAALAGSDASLPAMLLVDHIDVVEARSADWDGRNPFELREQDGFFYGRGVIDDKALSAIWVDSLARLRREGFVPRRTIKVALTCGEEGGGINGVKWLLAHRPEAVRAGFAFNEGGYGVVDADGKPLALHIAVGEKSSRNYWVEARAPGGHSSQPSMDNAIHALAGALTRVRALQFPVRLDDTSRLFLRRTGVLLGGELGQAMMVLAEHPDDAAAQRIVDAHPVHAGVLRTTCVPTLLEGGHAANALPQRARAHLQCRLLPGTDAGDVERAIVAAIDDPAIDVVEALRHGDEDAPTLAVAPPLDAAILDPAERLAELHFPGVPLIPKLLTAGTDGRYLSAAGIPTYGIPGIPLEPDGNRAHGIDERVRVESVYRGRDYLYDLLRRYAGNGQDG
ncbi:M20/M25/M40 family metallo-hydrolase [Luteimonas saliphila]|uniref:M20/M25/M40 family metallo-hydrolase n=1 Tax=Luteimonas saliphila TaxID=2804919 RepID=UPI001EE17F02|nr:M20/M25/M40 family metallo-hydrolase [Luteimonas saliphila]